MIEEDSSNGRWHLSHRLQCAEEARGDAHRPKQGLAVKMDHRAAPRVSSKQLSRGPSLEPTLRRVTNNSIHPGYCNFIRSETCLAFHSFHSSLPLLLSRTVLLALSSPTFLHLPLTVAFYESPMHDDHFI